MALEEWRRALERTRRSTFGRLASLFGATQLDDAFWASLEAGMIAADVGPTLSAGIVKEIRAQASDQGMTSTAEARQTLRSALVRRLYVQASPGPSGRPQVIVLVGVNGSGKTTTAARLAARARAAGETVLLAAADTYRAAATEQLAAWGERLQVDVIIGAQGGDPGAVAFDAAQASLARKVDRLIVDTSGRMHTRQNLMAELQKICRVLGKVIPGAPHQVLLVLDATTGQNGLAQGKAFSEAVGVTGVVLAKLDGSGKGGVGFAIASELGLPLQYVGLGEGLDDLAPLDPQAFVDGLIGDTLPQAA
jgi:fused signal recognition particle receptor